MLRSHSTNFLQIDSLSYVSSFPDEIFYEIGSYLGIKDLRIFSQTDRKIQLSVESLIPFKVQEHLEFIAERLVKTKFEIPKNFEKFDACKIKAANFKNGSFERCQALRGGICSLFENIWLNTVSIVLCDHPFSEDKLLTTQMIKNSRTDASILWRDNPKDNKIFCLILDLLKKNELDLKKIEYQNGNSLDEAILKCMIGVINENQSIVKIDIGVKKWNLIHLEQLLEAIKNNQHIKEISISEYNYSNRVFAKKPPTPEDIEQLKKIKELIIHHFGNAAIDNTLAQGYWHWTR